ncbi:hypothetical protein LTR53_005579 [Teratosphaeriaceae sp. CCFEE 6253]|nr:hypothetical protein LTR53_005579 [Teratosphaeriaceae sp. CCFEE 6253]
MESQKPSPAERLQGTTRTAERQDEQNPQQGQEQERLELFKAGSVDRDPNASNATVRGDLLLLWRQKLTMGDVQSTRKLVLGEAVCPFDRVNGPGCPTGKISKEASWDTESKCEVTWENGRKSWVKESTLRLAN